MFITIKGYQVEIDNDNFSWISKINFSPIITHDKVYFKYKRNGKTLLLHRTIINAERGQLSDHINGNSLNCKRDNLRICNYCQNAQNAKMNRRNRSNLKGIYFDKRYNRYYAEIVANHV